MRKTALLLSLVACVALVGSLLLAQDSPPKVVKEGANAADNPKAAKAAMTDEERAAAKAAKAEMAKLGDIGARMDKVIGGFSDDQKAKIAELNKAREGKLKEINDKLTADVVDQMTVEQKAKWEEAQKAAQNVKKGDKGAAKAAKGDAAKTGAPQEGGDAPK